MTYTPCRYAARWPELFAPLSDQQKQGISAALANGGLEGVEPTPQEIADLVALELGQIDHQEYQRRALERTRALGEAYNVLRREAEQRHRAAAVVESVHSAALEQ